MILQSSQCFYSHSFSWLFVLNASNTLEMILSIVAAYDSSYNLLRTLWLGKLSLKV